MGSGAKGAVDRRCAAGNRRVGCSGAGLQRLGQGQRQELRVGGHGSKGYAKCGGRLGGLEPASGRWNQRDHRARTQDEAPPLCCHPCIKSSRPKTACQHPAPVHACQPMSTQPTHRAEGHGVIPVLTERPTRPPRHAHSHGALVGQWQEGTGRVVAARGQRHSRRDAMARARAADRWVGPRVSAAGQPPAPPTCNCIAPPCGLGTESCRTMGSG